MEVSDELLAELAEAVSRQNAIDYAEAGPKAPYAKAVHLGVTLVSRYDVLFEYDQMRKALDFMPDLLARRVDSIFCDSKACAAYSVAVRPGMNTPILANAIFDAFASLGGFNWLDVGCDGETVLTESGYWPGEDGV